MVCIFLKHKNIVRSFCLCMTMQIVSENNASPYILLLASKTLACAVNLDLAAEAKGWYSSGLNFLFWQHVHHVGKVTVFLCISLKQRMFVKTVLNGYRLH